MTVGFLGTEFKASFAALIPSWLGILLYKDFTSKVARNVSSPYVFCFIDFMDEMRCAFDIKNGSASAGCGVR